MSTDKNQIKFVLTFPQGHILFMQAGGVYFLPEDADRAYMVWGERKELFGKNAVTAAADRETGAAGYSVVYEFGDDGALTDARLVSKEQTLRGSLAPQNVVDVISAAIGQGGISLLSYHDTRPERIFNVARFPDGRLLVQLTQKSELYIGTPGDYKKVDAVHAAQGGSSMYYRLATGGTVELPWGFGGPRMGEAPKYDGVELSYLLSEPDAAAIGFNLDQGIRPLTPFSAEILKRAPGASPKPPSA